MNDAETSGQRARNCWRLRRWSDGQFALAGVLACAWLTLAAAPAAASVRATAVNFTGTATGQAVVAGATVNPTETGGPFTDGDTQGSGSAHEAHSGNCVLSLSNGGGSASGVIDRETGGLSADIRHLGMLAHADASPNPNACAHVDSSTVAATASFSVSLTLDTPAIASGLCTQTTNVSFGGGTLTIDFPGFDRNVPPGTSQTLLLPPGTYTVAGSAAAQKSGIAANLAMSQQVGCMFDFTPLPKRPVLIVPGIGATYAANPTNDLPWLLQRGVAPSLLDLDPLSHAYDDLRQTLQNVGYVLDRDLFIVNYDWRLAPGPDDGAIDGRINGLTANGIGNGTFTYAVDYLGAVLRKAAEQWATDHPALPPLDAVDVIVHSTGGLVARVYAQSAAYGAEYAPGKTLPAFEHLIMVGVPNRGAAKAWNPLHDNWVQDPVFQVVLSKIINRAFQKVRNGAEIPGPDRTISLASLAAPDCLDTPEICFVDQYVPTARALLATYDFIDFGSGLTNVNTLVGTRNTLLLDLNAGLDLHLTGDPNAFANGSHVTVIYGTNGGEVPSHLPAALNIVSGTPTQAVEETGPFGGLIGLRSISNFDEFGSHDALPGEVWYRDIVTPGAGDGTVPTISAAGQFDGDPRVTLHAFTLGQNTADPVDHTALPHNRDVQRLILQTIGATFVDTDIAFTSNLGLSAINCAVRGCTNTTLDPVEGFLVDAQGRRLGYSAATGPLTEIPDSVWFGNADGIGWVFGPVEEPATLSLQGLGGPSYASATILGEHGLSGVIHDGVLANGDRKDLPITAPTGNQAPIASAGSDRVARQGSLVTLHGSATDPDAGPQPVTFAWTQSAGPIVTLSGATTAQPAFTATQPGRYSFSLIANDGASNSAAATVTIVVPRLGDVDLDGDVDQNDLNAIVARRNTPADSVNDVKDLDGNGVIDALDARIVATLCTRARCAVQ
jgi:hypothetical protein